MTSRLPASIPRPPKFRPVPSAFEEGNLVESTHPISFMSLKGSGFIRPIGIATLPPGTVFQVHQRIRKIASGENVPLLSNNAMYRLTKAIFKERTAVVGSIQEVPHDLLTLNPRRGYGYRSEDKLKKGDITYLMAPCHGNGKDNSTVQFEEGAMIEIRSLDLSNRNPGRTFDNGNLEATDKTPLNHAIYNVDVVEKIRYKITYLSCGYVDHSLLSLVNTNVLN